VNVFELRRKAGMVKNLHLNRHAKFATG